MGTPGRCTLITSRNGQGHPWKKTQRVAYDRIPWRRRSYAANTTSELTTPTKVIKYRVYCVSRAYTI